MRARPLTLHCTHLGEVRQRPTVVQMEVCDDDTGYQVIEAAGGAEELKIREPAVSLTG